MIRVLCAILVLLNIVPASAATRRRAVTTPSVLTLPFDFSAGTALGWEAGFADYNPAVEMHLIGELRALPSEVGNGKGWYLSGVNHSDDLFMFLRRRLSAPDGIRPDQNYIVRYRVTFATNAGRECSGVGGAPGEAVIFKLGAATTRPEPLLVRDHLRMNVDKANQNESGVHASNGGTISAEGLSCYNPHFVSLTRQHEHRYAIRSSPTAELWLLAGLDSGYEGVNALYIQKIEVVLSPVPPEDPRTRWQITYADVSALIAHLEQAGVTLLEIDRAHHELLSGRDVVFRIGGFDVTEELHVYVFETADATAQARSRISPDGQRIGDTTVEWVGPPHFFQGDHYLVNYAGSSPAVLSLLSNRLGSPFAGMQQSTSPRSGIALEATLNSGAVILSLFNGTSASVGYNLCASALERRSAGGWSAVPTETICTMELRGLPAGGSASYAKTLPSNLATGEYRYSTSVETGSNSPTVSSNSFTISNGGAR